MDHGGHGGGDDLIDCDGILIDKVLSALTRVHQSLGPGLFESVYESAKMIELAEINIPAKRQVEIPLRYRGKDLGIGFRADIVVFGVSFVGAQNYRRVLPYSRRANYYLPKASAI
jgi:GxxExxY protein